MPRTGRFTEFLVRRYRTLKNSSAVTPACLRMPESVPILSSRWSGTTHPAEPRRKIKRLPFCRIRADPKFYSPRIDYIPDIRGRLGGTCGHPQRRQEGLAERGRKKL